jgi:hypothetical protein
MISAAGRARANIAFVHSGFSSSMSSASGLGISVHFVVFALANHMKRI